MAEFFPDRVYRKGHNPNVGNIHLDLFRLLTIFLSQKEMANLRTGEWGDAFSELAEFEWDEVTRILLNAAVTARIIDDRDGSYLSKYPSVCGEFIPDLNDSNSTEELNLREACNKIIHAKEVHSDIEGDGQVPGNYMNPLIYFYGTQGIKEWKATLDIIKFVESYVNLVPS